MMMVLDSFGMMKTRTNAASNNEREKTSSSTRNVQKSDNCNRKHMSSNQSLSLVILELANSSALSYMKNGSDKSKKWRDIVTRRGRLKVQLNRSLINSFVIGTSNKKWCEQDFHLPRDAAEEQEIEWWSEVRRMAEKEAWNWLTLLDCCLVVRMIRKLIIVWW